MRTLPLIVVICLVSLAAWGETNLHLCKTQDGRACGTPPGITTGQSTEAVVASSAMYALPAVVGAFRAVADRREAIRAMYAAYSYQHPNNFQPDSPAYVEQQRKAYDKETAQKLHEAQAPFEEAAARALAQLAEAKSDREQAAQAAQQAAMNFADQVAAALAQHQLRGEQAFHLHTPVDADGGRAIRRLANQAYDLAKEATKNDELNATLDILTDLIFRADAIYDTTNTEEGIYHRRVSRRLLERARSLYDYATKGHSESAPVAMPRKAVELFGLGDVNTATFEGNEILKVAREAIEIPNIENEEFALFYLRTALQQAQADANAGNTQAVLQSVDRAWRLVDYAKGFTKGIVDFATETVKGVANLVMHPIDSAESIATAIIHYDETYDAIANAIEKVWNEYPDYSPEEKARFWGRATGEILSVVSGGSFLKLAKDAKTIAGFAQAAEFIEMAKGASVGRLRHYFQPGSQVRNIFGPLRKGPLHEIPTPSGGTVADTFRSSTYVEVVTTEPLKLYRVYSGKMNELSHYWSRTKPTGPLQAQLDSALDPSWGNLATNWVEITIPAGESFFEGTVAEVMLSTSQHHLSVGKLLGGGNQVFINRLIDKTWRTGRGTFNDSL